MDKGKPSQTAIVSAMTRASHLYRDGQPKVFIDEFALPFSGKQTPEDVLEAMKELHDQVAKESSSEFADALLRLNRANICLRQRYAEDEFQKAIANGVRQFVPLGAGLTSFAYRRTDLASQGVQIFEVDFPATQQWKTHLISELNLYVPKNLHLVPVDFQQDTLAEKLKAAGYRTDEPGFFSWLGVTMYLTDDAVFDTLRYIASGVSGTEVVFQYYLKPSLLSKENRTYLEAYESEARMMDEPWESFYDPTELKGRVAALGFSEVEDFTSAPANERYFSNRSDGLEDAGLSHHMKATV